MYRILLLWTRLTYWTSLPSTLVMPHSSQDLLQMEDLISSFTHQPYSVPRVGKARTPLKKKKKKISQGHMITLSPSLGTKAVVLHPLGLHKRHYFFLLPIISLLSITIILYRLCCQMPHTLLRCEALFILLLSYTLYLQNGKFSRGE